MPEVNPKAHQLIAQENIYEHTCLMPTCGHVWRSQQESPAVCVRCKSYKYDEVPKQAEGV